MTTRYRSGGFGAMIESGGYVLVGDFDALRGERDRLQKDKETRVDDTQYDPPSAGPLATASTNEPVPIGEQVIRAACAVIDALGADYNWNADPCYLTLIEGALAQLRCRTRGAGYADVAAMADLVAAGGLPEAQGAKALEPAADRRSLSKRLGVMADVLVHSSRRPTQARKDEIVLLLREAERWILEGR